MARGNTGSMLDVTSGPIFKRMLIFAVPIFFSGVLQQAFNTADLIVIGNFANSYALGGISVTGSIINLLVNFFMGLSVGASVSIAQHVGARDTAGARRHAHNAIATALVCGVAVAIAGNIFCRPILRLVDTPDEIIGYSEKYMRIYFAGTPAVLIYNYGSAIMRTMGDTKRPLFYLTIGGVANVVLNLLFVLVFKMDTDGVAIATIVSNIISASFVMYNLTHSMHCCRINISEVRIMKKEFFRITALGLPTGVQSAMFSISNILMQSSINSFGPSVVAGNAAGGNLDIYVNYVSEAFMQTAISFGGQNFGAGKHKRVKKIFIESVLGVAAISLVISLLITFFRYPLSRMYISDDPVAIEVSALRIVMVALPYFLCAMMSVASANIRAMGKSVVPMLATIFGVCVMRIIWIFTIFAIDRFHTLEMLLLIYPITWVLTFIFHVFTFIYFYRKMSRGELRL